MAGQDQGPIRTLGMVGGLGFQLGLTILLGALVGYYLDRRWGTSPWLILVGTLAGTAGGFFELAYALKGVSGKVKRGPG